VLLACCCIVAWSDDAPAPATAPAPAPAPAPDGNQSAITPVVPPEAKAVEPSDAPLTPEQVQLLNQTIDIGRIDVERLRDVLEGESAVEPVRMTLQDCIRLAIENNPDLQIVQYEELKANADIMTARGEFDPVLQGQANYLVAQQETSPEYQSFGAPAAVESYRTTSKLGISGKIKETGTMFDASFALDKEQSTFNKFKKLWSGGLTLTVSQPLLKNRGSINAARISLAKKAQQMSELQVRTALLTTVSQVTKSYWDLVGAILNVQVREQSLANAERLLEISRKRLDIGTGAAIDVLQAKAGVSTRQSDLIAARSRVADAEDLIKQILNMREAGVFSSRHIMPLDRPAVAEVSLEKLKNVDRELKKSIELALANRPEMLNAQLEIESAKIDRRRAANQMLPDVSVTGSAFNGERGDYIQDVFKGVTERPDNFYSVGVKGAVPLGNRAARGAYQRADLTSRQAGLKREKTKQDLMLRVRLAARAVHTSQILVDNNRQARTLQETNVAAEEKRLRLGVSTSYRVLQVQEDLALAQTNELQAQIGYEKALIDLKLAEGTILEHYGLDFAPPPPEEPVGFFRSVLPWPPPEKEE
jgi:outer membrane protein TolC